MSLFFHGVEEPDGRWRCHHGPKALDTHAARHEAVGHLRDLIAAVEGSAEIFLHHIDGWVEQLEGTATGLDDA